MSPILSIVISICIPVMLTFYLSPTYQVKADWLAVVLLIVSLGALGLHRSGVEKGIKPLAPLLAILLYAVALGISKGTWPNATPYMGQLLTGFIPYLLLYVVFRNQPPAQVPVLALAVFLVPGLVHLAFMYLDIFLAVVKSDALWSASSRNHWLEHLKDVPRVGRRYLSMALMHLLGAGLLMAWLFRHAPGSYWAWTLSFLSVLSLALLDARNAYVSAIIGLGVLLMAIGPMRIRRVLNFVPPTRLAPSLVLVGLLIGAVGIGYSAGKSRWLSMSYSFATAIHDVFISEVELSRRPFVDAGYWNKPIEDFDTCHREKHHRCMVDQSAYLRMAWFLSGAQSIIAHPWGIGYSTDYMARYWGIPEGGGTYNRVDSFLIECMISFGLVGCALYALLVFALLQSLRRALQAETASAVLVIACGIVLVCVGRAMVDTLDEGLWRYVMASMGMYYGTLHAIEGTEGSSSP